MVGNLIEQIDAVVFDCEATSIDAQHAELIEIGAVRVKGGRCVSQFQSLIKPRTQAISARIEALTGITQEDVAHAPALEIVLRQFLDFITPAKQLGGYFISLDLAYLQCAALITKSWELEKALEARSAICAKSLARLLCPELGEEFDLAKLGRHLRVGEFSLHRALSDAAASAKVLEQLLIRANRRGISSVAELLEFQIAPVTSPWQTPSRDPRKIESNAAAQRRWEEFVMSASRMVT